MKSLTKENLIQFIKFGLVGCSNAIISISIYSILVYINLNYELANFIAFSISVINAFFWNNKFVFIKQKNQERSFILTFCKTYISYAFTGLFLQSLELYILIDSFGINKYFSQIICILINLPINYLINKLWAFKTHNRENNND